MIRDRVKKVVNQLTRIIGIIIRANELSQTRRTLFVSPVTALLTFYPCFPWTNAAVRLCAYPTRPVFIFSAAFVLVLFIRFPRPFLFLLTSFAEVDFLWRRFLSFFFCNDFLYGDKVRIAADSTFLVRSLLGSRFGTGDILLIMLDTLHWLTICLGWLDSGAST